MRKGYNRYQVDMAIHNLEEENAALKKNLEAYRLQSEEDQNKILSLQQQLKDMTHDIEVKESAATQMAQIALKEANQIIQNANDNADAIIKEAYYCARDILESISRLGVEAQGIKDSMNEQLVQLIESIERFDVPPIPSAELLKKCDE